MTAMTAMSRGAILPSVPTPRTWTRPTFRGSLDSLERRSATSNLAIMCAETLWWRCHRRLIADALVVDGFEVVHLGLDQDVPHVLSETVRVLDNGLLLYDVDPSGP